MSDTWVDRSTSNYLTADHTFARMLVGSTAENQLSGVIPFGQAELLARIVRESVMPMLFWLPLIFMSAVVELSTPIQLRAPIASRQTPGTD